MQRESDAAAFGPPEAAALPEEGRLYRHYKGDLYRVICACHLSEQRGQAMVVYRSMLRHTNWARPLEMWNELVTWPDGVRRPRFVEEAALTLEAIKAPLV